MGWTPYSSANQEFSNKAHQQARIEIYPLLFDVPADRLAYVELPNAQDRDFNQGIDKTIQITVPDLHGSLGFSVQERFRRPSYASFQDMTITEYNLNSGMLGELYKIEADLMLYGYYNPLTSGFIEAIACWVPALKANIARQNTQQQLGHNYRSNQDFLCFKFDELEKLSGVVAFRKMWAVATSSSGALHKPSNNNHTYTKQIKQTLETIKRTEIIERQSRHWRAYLDWDEEGQQA
jgi:hypothetical protein